MYMYLGSIKCLQILIMLGANFNETDAEGLNGILVCYFNNIGKQASIYHKSQELDK